MEILVENWFTHPTPMPLETSYAELESKLLALIGESPAEGAALLSDEKFNDLALAIHQFQREQNAPYARFCESQNAPRAITTWREIPAVPTQAFRLAPLRTFSAEETSTTFLTSGTTGEGRGQHHFASLRLYKQSILSAWRALKVPALPQIILTPRFADAPHSSLSCMMDTLGSEAPQTWCITRDNDLDIAAFEAAAASGKPVAILGTALAFLHLFERLDGSPLPLPPGSYALETGGYKGTGRTLTKEALYAQFETTLGLKPDDIQNEYSMTELSSQWYTHGIGQPHKGPPWTRSVVIDPETGTEVADGETGVIRLIDLANLGSVIAIQTQDLAIRRGRDFQLIGRDPAAIPRGCSRSADEQLTRH